MIINEKLYTSMCLFFTSLLILGNLTYQKFVSINITFIHNFELSVGAMLYPLTFLLTDLITEFYGKEKANFCVSLGMLMNIIVAMLISLMDYLPATIWSKLDNNIFHQVFGFYGVAFIGSLLACYIAQAVDISLYLWIRKITGEKYLWLRSNGSSSVSLLIDTTIVISFLTIFGVLPREQMWILIFNSYLWKLFFIICSTPLFYILVKTIKWLLESPNPQLANYKKD